VKGLLRLVGAIVVGIAVAALLLRIYDPDTLNVIVESVFER
jgi:hypothetical protein